MYTSSSDGGVINPEGSINHDIPVDLSGKYLPLMYTDLFHEEQEEQGAGASFYNTDYTFDTLSNAAELSEDYFLWMKMTPEYKDYPLSCMKEFVPWR